MSWKRHFAVAFLLSAPLLATALGFLPQDRIASLTADELARGKKIFEGQCALCHGIGGTGSRGPALNQPKLQRADDNFALFRIIKGGIPDSEMPQFWQLTDQEIWQVAGYVRSLMRTEAVKLTGDAARGKALYETKGDCASCHLIRDWRNGGRGQGGVAGPELTEIGLRRSPSYLREALLDPNAATPDGFLVVSITTNSGRRVRGVRVNEDSFSIQLRDGGNRFHSFRKSELKELKKEFGVSTMPGYKDAFTAAEIDDLVAYLAGLRGGK
jgi:putative heme-binding domain-containing protein